MLALKIRAGEGDTTVFRGSSLLTNASVARDSCPGRVGGLRRRGVFVTRRLQRQSDLLSVISARIPPPCADIVAVIGVGHAHAVKLRITVWSPDRNRCTCRSGWPLFSISVPRICIQVWGSVTCASTCALAVLRLGCIPRSGVPRGPGQRRRWRGGCRLLSQMVLVSMNNVPAQNQIFACGHAASVLSVSESASGVTAFVDWWCALHSY